MNRKIVMDTGPLFALKSQKRIFETIAKAGFKYYDYSLFWKGVGEHIGVNKNYKEKALEVRKLGESFGLSCEQSHAYFGGGSSLEELEHRIDLVSKDIEIASILGAKCIVIHPVLDKSLEWNVEFLKKHFLPLAHKFDIKLAVENVWTVIDDKKATMCTSKPADFVRFLDSCNDPYVVGCLDIGHAEMNQMGTSAEEMIKTLGNRIYCLHIHDNDKWCDSHQLPYTQQINFTKVLKALKEINYQGNITFEIETCYHRGEEPEASLPLELYEPFLRLEREIGEYWVNYLDK